MQDSLDYVETENKAFPVFLKVLCILTFVGAGFGFLSGLYSFFTIESTFSKLGNLPGGNLFNFMSADMADFIFWGRISAGVTTVCNALCIVGAIMMMQLKRTGYFLYLIGEIPPAIFSIIITLKQAEMMKSLFAGMPGGNMVSTFTWFGIVFQILFVAAFIIMYTLNLKHLKK